MQINWKEVLKLLITVLTAIAGTLGLASCMSQPLPRAYREGKTIGKFASIEKNIYICIFE